jgi:hypothetical protein
VPRLSNERVTLGQSDGSEVELVVNGTALYATYETLEGYPVVYESDAGMFCYARLSDGRFESSGVPVALPPPSGVRPHEKESDDVRAMRIEERRAQIEQRSRGSREQEEEVCDERDLR